MNYLFFLLAAGWLSVQTPQFEVLTNAGDRTAREVLAKLEQIQRAFPPGATTQLPVRVYIFRSRQEFAAFRPSEATTGFYQSGPERDIIAMENNWEAGRIVYHEYVHLVMHHSTAKLPMWLEEGMAEFYSTLEVGGKRLRVGVPVASHIRALSELDWLTAEQMGSMSKDSREYNERSRVGIFYAQSWALVHMLNTAPAYRTHMQQFAALLAEGTSAAAAFEQAFGVTLAMALRELHGVVEAKRFRSLDVQWEGAAGSIPEQRGLTKAEAELKRAELFLALGRMEQAQSVYESLSRDGEVGVAIEAGLGAVAMGMGRYNTARQHLERAIELGSTDAATHFEYAMLLRESGAPRPKIEQALRTSLRWNPRHVEAHFLLASMLSSAGDQEQAIVHLKQAIDVLPRQSSFWQALALAYFEAGKQDAASGAAERAVANAATPQEENMAAGLLRMISQKRAR